MVFLALLEKSTQETRGPVKVIVADKISERGVELLRKTGWKIKGVDGAAELLGVKPTTLISRIEKMGLKRSLLKEDVGDLCV